MCCPLSIIKEKSMNKLILALTLLSSISTFASQGGNGADAIACYDKPLFEEVTVEKDEKLSNEEVIESVVVSLKEKEDYKSGKYTIVKVDIVKSKIEGEANEKEEVKVLSKIKYPLGEEAKLVSAQLLDLYEKRVKNNQFSIQIFDNKEQEEKVMKAYYQLAPDEAARDELVEEGVLAVLNRLKTKDPSRANRLIERLKGKNSKLYPLYSVVRGRIPDAKDSDYNLRDYLDENCYEVPLAYQQTKAEVFPGDPKVLIRGQIYNSEVFSYQDKVGTLLHELYLEEDIKYNAARGSDGIRFFTYLSMSEFVDYYSSDEYFLIMKEYNLAYPSNSYHYKGLLVKPYYDNQNIYILQEEADILGPIGFIKSSIGTKIYFDGSDWRTNEISSNHNVSVDIGPINYTISHFKNIIKENDYQYIISSDVSEPAVLTFNSNNQPIEITAQSIQVLYEESRDLTKISFPKGATIFFKTKENKIIIPAGDSQDFGDHYLYFYNNLISGLSSKKGRDKITFITKENYETTLSNFSDLSIKFNGDDTIDSVLIEEHTRDKYHELRLIDSNSKYKKHLMFYKKYENEYSSLSISFLNNRINTVRGFQYKSDYSTMDTAYTFEKNTVDGVTSHKLIIPQKTRVFGCAILGFLDCIEEEKKQAQAQRLKAEEEKKEEELKRIEEQKKKEELEKQYPSRGVVNIQGESLFASSILYSDDYSYIKSITLDSDMNKGIKRINFLNIRGSTVKIPLKRKGRVRVFFYRNQKMTSWD